MGERTEQSSAVVTMGLPSLGRQPVCVHGLRGARVVLRDADAFATRSSALRPLRSPAANLPPPPSHPSALFRPSVPSRAQGPSSAPVNRGGSHASSGRPVTSHGANPARTPKEGDASLVEVDGAAAAAMTAPPRKQVRTAATGARAIGCARHAMPLGAADVHAPPVGSRNPTDDGRRECDEAHPRQEESG